MGNVYTTNGETSAATELRRRLYRRRFINAAALVCGAAVGGAVGYASFKIGLVEKLLPLTSAAFSAFLSAAIIRRIGIKLCNRRDEREMRASLPALPQPAPEVVRQPLAVTTAVVYGATPSVTPDYRVSDYFTITKAPLALPAPQKRFANIGTAPVLGCDDPDDGDPVWEKCRKDTKNILIQMKLQPNS
jgi:hypothetical protein